VWVSGNLELEKGPGGLESEAGHCGERAGKRVRQVLGS
jgi:hypothetical protein